MARIKLPTAKWLDWVNGLYFRLTRPLIPDGQNRKWIEAC